MSRRWNCMRMRKKMDMEMDLLEQLYAQAKKGGWL